jgi:CheY-like chemotaxis protein
MSHEIRTPMNGIIGLTLLALNEQTSPQVRDYLHKISTSSHCLLDILNDILDFSKIEAGQMTIDAVPFALDSLVSNLSNLYEGSATSKQLGFSVEVADGIPPQLIGDIVRLQQILSNLIGNAIKFTSHGHVALKIRLKQFNDAQVVLVFAVEDTGIGISDLDQSKLFQSFSQVDGAITRKFGGTGLGLAISQRLLNLMGTACQVKSKPGQGAIFSFELCLGVAANMPVLESIQSKIPMPGGLEQELKLSLNPIQGARILLVEDNRINQLVVKKFLELSRLEVTLANNGLEAINLLENSDFDAILMDVHMPVMDGIEATKLIIETGKHPHLPIIALTAGVTSEEREACAESGMCDFIAKPVHSEILASKLLKWVKK